MYYCRCFVGIIITFLIFSLPVYYNLITILANYITHSYLNKILFNTKVSGEARNVICFINIIIESIRLFSIRLLLANAVNTFYFVTICIQFHFMQSIIVKSFCNYRLL